MKAHHCKQCSNPILAMSSGLDSIVCALQDAKLQPNAVDACLVQQGVGAGLGGAAGQLHSSQGGQAA